MTYDDRIVREKLRKKSFEYISGMYHGTKDTLNPTDRQQVVFAAIKDEFDKRVQSHIKDTIHREEN